MRFARLVALALAALTLGALPATAKPAIWTVRSAQATITLFGSIHLLPAGLDWRPAALDDAIAHADEIWFELPIDPATDAAASAIAIRRGVLVPDRHLAMLLSPGEAARLAQAATTVGVPPAALDQMQPWLADLTLSVAADVLEGAEGSDGVEQQLQRLAPASVPRRAFETPDQQIGFLAGGSVKDQLASLDWTLHEINDDPGSYKRIVGEWMAADVAGLQRDAVDPVRRASQGLYERLIDQRNRHWAQVLAERLKKPGHIVVVVGAGHLVGEAGLPALLRARGFAVEGP
jgi:uncharacterized protein YbaP (TraB family)